MMRMAAASNPYGRVATKEGLLNSFFDVYNSEMPFRNFTLRLYTRLLFRFDPTIDIHDDHAGGSNLTRQ